MPDKADEILTTMFDVYQAALQDLRGRCEASLQQARDLILSASGNIIVCGMGKSGLVGRKISATLSSTGTPSVFLHPAEAMHGDLGIVRKGDVMILISYSGETEEVVRLLPALRRLEVKIIAIVGQVNSTLGKAASICLDATVDKEACPLNLAPTTSTLTTLVLGDALAILLMQERGFQSVDFAATHPGGKLGKKLLNTVGDVMRTHDLPFVPDNMPMTEVIIKMTEGRLGLALVGTADNLQGIITDGDLRRMLVDGRALADHSAAQVMNPAPQAISADTPFGHAEELMTDARIQCLVVTDKAGAVAGIIQIF